MTKVYIYIMLISIILFFSYVNSLNNDVVEHFTPIHRFCRPYIRHTRRFGTKIYDNFTSKFSNFYKKINR